LLQLVRGSSEPPVELRAGDCWSRQKQQSRLQRLLIVRRQSSLLENQPVFNSSRLAAWLRRVRDAGINARVLVDVSVVATPGEAKLLERIPRFNRVGAR
jgi:uncharacterized membrane protein